LDDEQKHTTYAFGAQIVQSRCAGPAETGSARLAQREENRFAGETYSDIAHAVARDTDAQTRGSAQDDRGAPRPRRQSGATSGSEPESRNCSPILDSPASRALRAGGNASCTGGCRARKRMDQRGGWLAILRCTMGTCSARNAPPHNEKTAPGRGFFIQLVRGKDTNNG
jgi:hypothetical protein